MHRATFWNKASVLVSAAVLAVQSGALAQEMPKSVPDVVALEKADRLPITDFYTPPVDLYSLDATGYDVATSGVVLIPAGAPPWRNRRLHSLSGSASSPREKRRVPISQPMADRKQP
jgi:hypothetical protein